MNWTSIVRAAAIAAIAATAVIALSEALAEEPNNVPSRPVQAVTGAAEQIPMTMGKGGLFQTSAPYAKISVADEKIVDVTPQSDREFIFTPKAIGSTNVFVFNEKGALIASLDVNVVGQFVRTTVREETGRVKIYNVKGSLAKPALYQCNGTNCELEGEADNTGAGPAGTVAPAAAGGAAPATDSAH